MNEVFWRQFAAYADYHRDKRNCAMHIIGTPLLFLAAVLPLSLLSVTVWGMSTIAAALLVVPALIFWMVHDLAIGAAIACAVIPLLITGGDNRQARRCSVGMGNDSYAHRCRLVIANCRALLFRTATASTA